MYGDPGRAYLYLVYGMHTCLNVVTEQAGRPAAVLIRAVELDTGIDAARILQARRVSTRRRLAPDAATVARELRRIETRAAIRLAAGPGLVGAAFGLDPTSSGLDLCDPSSRLRLQPPGPDAAPFVVETTPRVGIGYAGEPWTSLPWRFVAVGSRALSGPHR